jgi:hypothetical protein
MPDRRKTAWILGTATLIMFSPLAMVLAGYSIPMFQILGLERETMASPMAWILATMVAIGYVLYTMRAVHLYGTLLSNVPDYTGSQIQVDRIQVEG